MKILHGHVGTNVRVKVDANPENCAAYEHVEGHGYFAEHGDSTFSVDPDGTLCIYGDRSKPAHHFYRPYEWLWVGDENDNCAFNEWVWVGGGAGAEERPLSLRFEMIRRVRRLRQLVPTKFATAYIHHPAHEEPTAEFTTWWMWFHHCFRQRTTVLGRVVETVNPDGSLTYG